jgi:NAD+ synthase (glutamine-hydrolysing)
MAAAFNSIYSHGFIRIAAAVPLVRIGDPSVNAERTIELAQEADARHAALVAFPELGLSGYSIDDLLHQSALLSATETAIEQVRVASESLQVAIVVGAPLRVEQGIFNTAVVVQGGEILGVVPKSFLPEYREFYEKRQFRAARDAVADTIRLNGATVPFGNDLIFDAAGRFSFAVEICEDLWSPIPPSTYAAMAGATVLINLSASNITVGKSDYRHTLAQSHSARTLSAYLYTAAGFGESTTDLAWDGQSMIYENGELLVESARFQTEPSLSTADVDLDRLISDRASTSSWGDSIHDHRVRLAALRSVPSSFSVPEGEVPLDRELPRFPYVPANPASRNERCAEVYNIQVAGLQTRLEATRIQKIVIGVSGGLDSTHALIVAARALDRLELPRTNILAYTMPGFGTSSTTLNSARELMRSLGVTANELDIRAASEAMLKSIRHPAGEGEALYDVTYENVQAGERTSHLFRLANFHNALVLGTGDLSELALGWATYGVGDQMSHYAINASVPKTLIQFLLNWAIDTEQFDSRTSAVLEAVLNTAISPELIPSSNGEHPEQHSEEKVGPYELQDFFLYYVLRFGYAPSKVAWLADHAWGSRERGRWPDLVGETKRNEYSLEEISRWLEVFLDRFFRTSQFKRTAIPNAPKVGSGGSLSPRGDWRAPSDGNSSAWLAELRQNGPA